MLNVEITCPPGPKLAESMVLILCEWFFFGSVSSLMYRDLGPGNESSEYVGGPHNRCLQQFKIPPHAYALG